MIGRVVRLLATVLTAMALVGVAAAAEKPRFIMVTHGAASDPFWAAIKEGADEAAAEAGVALTIVRRIRSTSPDGGFA